MQKIGEHTKDALMPL